MSKKKLENLNNQPPNILRDSDFLNLLKSKFEIRTPIILKQNKNIEKIVFILSTIKDKIK